MVDLLLDEDKIFRIIKNSLEEDIGSGDVTTDAVVKQNIHSKAVFIAKSDGIVAGINIARKVFEYISIPINFTCFFNDGNRVKQGDQIAFIEGPLKTLLTGERTALNILQRMSGIATTTKKYVEAVEGTKAKILDTRKTAPGLRCLDKYAVKLGGGTNHRLGLFDMILIKDNHIKAAGSITEAYEEVKKYSNPSLKIEIETSSISEVIEALKCSPDIIMLDNMNIETMKSAVDLINGKIKTEASGNITLENIRAVAETGVDYISIGALTHSVNALDISMKITN